MQTLSHFVSFWGIALLGTRCIHSYKFICSKTTPSQGDGIWRWSHYEGLNKKEYSWKESMPFNKKIGELALFPCEDIASCLKPGRIHSLRLWPLWNKDLELPLFRTSLKHAILAAKTETSMFIFLTSFSIEVFHFILFIVFFIF